MARRSISSRCADFETTTNPLDCRVWSWGSMAVDDYSDYVIGIGVGSYVAYMLSVPSVTYFHNLAFDGSFILDYILKDGYTWVAKNPGKGQFSTVISNMNKFYSITIVSKEGVKVELRDSLKKIPLPVRDVPKAFNLNSSKGDIDYEMERPIGYLPSQEEWNYLYRDIFIMAQAMRIILASGMKRLTVGADSLAEFKSLHGKGFERTFPVLSKTVDDDIRLAYRGGIAMPNRKWARKLVGRGIVIDKNSMYPWVMRTKLLPYGKPWWSEVEDDNADLFIISITFTAKLKPNHIPCIQIKRSIQFNSQEFLEEVKEPTTVSITSVDLEMWQEQYDLKIWAINGYWNFKGIEGLFNDYIDKWMAVKANSTGGARTIAKLHLNSLYGKFAKNTDVTGKRPVLDDTGTVQYVMCDHEESNPVYTAMGAFITAYARADLIRSAQANYDRFLYCDTDSLHLLGEEEPDLWLHPTELGAWKVEHDGQPFDSAVFLRAKQYCERFGDHDDVHIAGLPHEIAAKVRLEDMLHPRTWDGKLVPKRVPGGTVLTSTTFTLK
nr:MAG TPA: DNA polymerase B [Caudoviricetes sp.]